MWDAGRQNSKPRCDARRGKTRGGGGTKLVGGGAGLSRGGLLLKEDAKAKEREEFLCALRFLPCKD